MTEVQITVQLPDQVESMEQLEAVIDAKGQQIKQQLFEHQLASLIQQQKAAESSRKQQPRISHVQNAKKEPSSKVINPAN